MVTTTEIAPQPISRPNFEVLKGACNCHVHVMGPRAEFPLFPGRPLTYGVATAEELSTMLGALMLERVIVVQSVIYGTDNRCLVDAIRKFSGRARGIAVIDPEVSNSVLENLHRDGVRGVRVVINSPEASERLMPLALKIQPLGWHLQIYGELPILFAKERELCDLPVPLVIDHLGGAKASEGPGQPGFNMLLRLLRSGNTYMKLSGLHRCSGRSDLADVEDLVLAAAEAAPERLVWGNDWPHPAHSLSDMVTASKETLVPWSNIDDGADFNLIPRWLPDPCLRRLILVDNPARLYGFPSA